MTDEGQASIAELKARIAATRREYEGLRDTLESKLGRQFMEPSAVADRFLSVIDEFGVEHASDLLAERPADFGERYGQGDGRADADDLRDTLNELVDAHERLDDLTGELDKLTRTEQTKSTRVINIQGQAYDFDAEKRELREVASGERHGVALEEIGGGRPLTLTQQAAREAQAPKAQPRGNRDRTRTR